MNESGNTSEMYLIKDYLEYTCGLECEILKNGSFKVDVDGVYFSNSFNTDKLEIMENNVLKIIDNLRKLHDADFDYKLGYNTFILIPIFY